MSRSSAESLPASPFARMRSITSSRTPLRRAAPTWAAHTYAASRSRTAVRMATERSFASTTLSSRKKVTSGRIRSASFGLWSSMLNGPRMLPNTFWTASTTAWCSAGTSDLPVMGATRGMLSSFRESQSGCRYSRAAGKIPQRRPLLQAKARRVRAPECPTPQASPGSAELDPVLLQRLVAQLEPESRRLRQRHVAVDDRWALAKQLEPQGIARRVGEGLENESGRARRNRVHMDLGIVMRGERDLIQLGHDRRLAPGRQPAGPGRVDDEVVDQALGHHRAQAEGAVLRLAGRDRDRDVRLQALQGMALVEPGHRVLEPEDVVRRAQIRRARRGGEIPSLVRIEHDRDVVAHRLPDQTDPCDGA